MTAPIDTGRIRRTGPSGMTRRVARMAKVVAVLAWVFLPAFVSAADYTKVANNGSNLPDGAGLGSGALDWACTRVNATGLVFEIKVATPGALRNQAHTYTWHDSNAAANGGVAGTANGGTCAGSACDTAAYVAAVNAAQLCGFSNWRLPTRAELQQIVRTANQGTGAAMVDASFFPNLQASSYWTVANFAANPQYAWQVSYRSGSGSYRAKSTPLHVLVVRQ